MPCASLSFAVLPASLLPAESPGASWKTPTPTSRGRAVNYDMDTGSAAGQRQRAVGADRRRRSADRPSELVKWADNYRKPRVGGPRLLAAQLGNSVEIFPGGPRYGAGLFIGGNGQFGHGGDWLGFESSFQVSADHTRSMAVTGNSCDINSVAGQLSAIRVAPPA